MKNDFKLCPMCGSKNIECINNRKWKCPECGFDLYNNVAAAVGVIIYDNEKNVLFEIRAKEPRKGYAALPGGFVDFDESAEEAVLRECREELGVELELKNIQYIFSYPNTYPYKNIEYKTCDIFFAAELPEQYSSIQNLISKLHPEESEVQKLNFYKATCVEDVEKIPFAFESSRKTLLSFVEKMNAK